MALRLDPDHPLVWRTPHSAQYGVERPSARFDRVDLAHELVFALLGRGVPRPVLFAAAASRGVGADAVSGVLAELGPLVLDGAGPPRLPLLRVCVDGREGEARAFGTVLELAGGVRHESGSARAPDAAVLVSHFATSPRSAARWLREDVPHVLVEFGDRSVRVGPVVVPGRGPCAECLELRRTERDPAWPAMAGQLSARTAPAADALGVVGGAALTARVLAEHFADPDRSPWATRAVRLARPGGIASDALGRRTALTRVERVSAHPRCGCRSPAGSGRAAAHPTAASRPPPTTGGAADGPG